MATKKIIIELKGMHVDDEHIRLGDFIAQLGAFGEALKQTDRIVSGKDTTTTYYTIDDLSYASPFKVVLGVYPIDPAEDYSEELVENFSMGMKEISHGRIPPNYDYEILESYKEICKKIDKGISYLVINTNGDSHNITEDFQSRIQLIQGPDELVRGSISGKIEAINLHGGANEFRIFPNVGPKRLTCHFPKRLIEQAVASVNKHATVYGSMKYKSRSKYPHEINIDSIEISPSVETLPTLSQLRGIAPNLTGGISSEEFVRKQRDLDG